jgi:hypothetical protein
MGGSVPYRAAISAGSGFDLMLTRLAPRDDPGAGDGSVAERHRLVAVGVHHARRQSGTSVRASIMLTARDAVEEP